MDNERVLGICDRSRLGIFQAITDMSRRWPDFQTMVSAEGVSWHYFVVDGAVLGLTTLAAGWIFDPFLRQHRSNEADTLLNEYGNHNIERNFQELKRSLRFGRQSERLLWLIHRRILQVGFSSILLADRECATSLWGPSDETWPKHWRGNIKRLLDALTWLHVCPRTSDGSFEFGNQSVLLTYTADMRGTGPRDQCEVDCPFRSVGTHHHYRVSIGRGFLGALEQCASSENEFGVREYAFFEKQKLRRLGRQGFIGEVFLPAKLGSPECCRILTAHQHRLLQALIQEGTRRRKTDSRETTIPVLVQNATVPDFDGHQSLCPLLRPEIRYVVFGGNGYRPGRGYLLSSAGGWSTKAGYPRDRPDLFLRDLGILADHLGLIIVGATRRSERWFDRLQLVRLACSQQGRRVFDDIHVRIYAPEGCWRRWTEFFGWRDSISLAPQMTPERIATLLIVSGIRQQDFARQLQVDPSLLSRYLSGKRPMPPRQLARAAEMLSGPSIQPCTEE